MGTKLELVSKVEELDERPWQANYQPRPTGWIEYTFSNGSSIKSREDLSECEALALKAELDCDADERDRLRPHAPRLAERAWEDGDEEGWYRAGGR